VSEATLSDPGQPAGGDHLQSILRRLTPQLRTTYGAELALFGTPTRLVLILVAALVVIFFPALFGPFATSVLTVGALTLIGAVALNLLQGVAGQVSAGNAAFMAVGAVTAGVMVRMWPGVPFLLVLPLSGLAAAGLGALVAIPAVRVRGLYLLISTLALHYIVAYAVFNLQRRTVGPTGWIMPTPTIGPFAIDRPLKWYYVLMFLAVLSLWHMQNILRTRVGRSWIAVRDGDIAAEILGVNVIRAKLDAFVITSFVIGLQGSLFAYYTQVLSSELFTLDLAITYIAIVIVGGMGSAMGTVLGTLAVVGLPFAIQQAALQLPPDFSPAHILLLHIFDVNAIAYGGLIMIFLLFAPGGLVQLLGRLVGWIRLWPFSRERAVR
jgi:branched-chain amino acid transport system permease protein